MRRAVLISGGDINDYEFISGFIRDDDYIVCADRGIVHCDKMNLKANLWVGDFDSCDYEEYKNCPAAGHAEVIRIPTEKDKTDTEYALDCIEETKQFRNILLIGGIGSRMDHTLANIFMIEKMAECEVYLELLNEKNRIRLSRDSGVYLEKSVFKYVSILPVSEIVNGVTCTGGFKYKLDNAVMFRKNSLGISNEIVGESASVYVSEGCALIIESRD